MHASGRLPDMRDRKVSVPALAACRALVITACGVVRAGTVPNQERESAPSNELTVWYFDKLSMDTVIPLFEKSHSGVTVNFVEQPFAEISARIIWRCCRR
jgi:ABC-type glycerol-3-phosphate transport system substrate-binding protein